MKLLSGERLAVMTRIFDQPGISLSELRMHVCGDRPILHEISMYRAVADMKRRGWIKEGTAYRAYAGKAHRKPLTLTKAGHTELSRNAKIIFGVEL